MHESCRDCDTFPKRAETVRTEVRAARVAAVRRIFSCPVGRKPPCPPSHGGLHRLSPFKQGARRNAAKGGPLGGKDWTGLLLKRKVSVEESTALAATRGKRPETESGVKHE